MQKSVHGNFTINYHVMQICFSTRTLIRGKMRQRTIIMSFHGTLGTFSAKN